ncbi:MAG TPA: hypothetical protein VLK25_04425 [Allosphingosinicella sp.]|nr:hypothetical protein [Allosphingosinicella sp.]
MARLSVSTAWNETTALVKAEARLLFPLAFMAIALPAAVTRALAPLGPAEGEARASPIFIAAIAVTLVLTLIGYLAISHLALKRGASVREALAQGARRAPALAAASLLVGCGLAAIAFVLAFIVSAATIGASGREPNMDEMARAALILFVLLIPVFLYFSGRVALMTPAAAAETAGPFALIARSWRLTKPHQLKMAGLVTMLGLLALVLQLAVESVLGILLIAVAGPAAPGSPSSILLLLCLALLTTVLAIYGVALIARVYAQLAETAGGSAG